MAPSSNSSSRAYPRRRGGTTVEHSYGDGDWGLSPQARGNPRPCATPSAPCGPIPAGAGEPQCRGWHRSSARAYPRRRGGTLRPNGSRASIRGLSPQARGNRLKICRLPQSRGPIPAGAGEPRNLLLARLVRRAYPRRRGGTIARVSQIPRCEGLSPQARGNPPRPTMPEPSTGPIPAGAGEPLVVRSLWFIGGAYPRRRGGTASGAGHTCIYAGLSPQARGNLPAPFRSMPLSGPIPAGAGEPCCFMRPPRVLRAYPRRRGGTLAQGVDAAAWGGLSPQARGNPLDVGGIGGYFGPIPAGAGEPDGPALVRNLNRAYPRRRGGTHWSCSRMRRYWGLSPQARGNHGFGLFVYVDVGPIPAGAGEPAVRSSPRICAGAYPRRRGGTPGSRAAGAGRRGLSPQARGNQAEGGSGGARRGPIPAGAGEPSGDAASGYPSGAYPRRRGGTPCS